MQWGCFQRQGLGKWSEKTESWMQLNTDIHNENLVQSTQILRLGWKFTFQHDPTHTAKTMQEWLRDDSMNVLEWPRLGGNQTSLEKPINGCPPMVPSQPDRVWDHLKRRKAQPKKCKACHIIPKKTWGCNRCQSALIKFWVKGMKTSSMSFFQCFLFNKFAKLW